jgi:hypothetical protein
VFDPYPGGSDTFRSVAMAQDPLRHINHPINQRQPIVPWSTLKRGGEGEVHIMPVHIMAVLGTARQVYGVYTTLKSFVEDEMATFLRDMGERQFDAAVQHLENGTRTPAMMSDYALLAIGDLENAYRTFEASAPRGFRLRIRSALGPYAMEERATAYEKACATVLLHP